MLASPHDFFVRVREGSHGFQGVMKATLPRGEAYEFLELGAHLERADSTARLLSVDVPGLTCGRDAPNLLKSCGAFEAFRKQESDDELRPERVVEYLLLDRHLPRAVCFWLERSLEAIRAISVDTVRPERAIGRVFAELAFAELYALDSTADQLLRRVLLGIADAADEIAAGYFTTRTVPPGPYAQQQQQQ